MIFNKRFEIFLKCPVAGICCIIEHLAEGIAEYCPVYVLEFIFPVRIFTVLQEGLKNPDSLSVFFNFLP
jgi:hypothetical protein